MTATLIVGLYCKDGNNDVKWMNEKATTCVMRCECDDLSQRVTRYTANDQRLYALCSLCVLCTRRHAGYLRSRPVLAMFIPAVSLHYEGRRQHAEQLASTRDYSDRCECQEIHVRLSLRLGSLVQLTKYVSIQS